MFKRIVGSGLITGADATTRSNRCLSRPFEPDTVPNVWEQLLDDHRHSPVHVVEGPQKSGFQNVTSQQREDRP